VVSAGRTSGAVPATICRAVPVTVCGTLIVFSLKRVSFGSANANPIMTKPGVPTYALRICLPCKPGN
jgi:hypothetical protein